MNYTELDFLILKNIVSSKKNALEFVNTCDTKIFSTDVWRFANIVTSYVKTFKEVPTLRVITEKFAKSNDQALIKYCNDIWNKLDSTNFNEKEFAFDLTKLKNRYAEKQLLVFKDSIVDGKLDLDKGLSDLQKLYQNVRSVREKKTYEKHNIKDYLPIFKEKFLSKRNNPELEIGIKTGFSFFDEATNGAKGSDLVLITAESGFGKSTWLLNAAIGMWLQKNLPNSTEGFSVGHNIAYFSLEMPYENCFNRFLSRLSGVPYKKIENANTNKEETSRVKTALDFIHAYPYNFEIIDIPDANSNQINAILDDVQAEVVFVDYLGIMNTNEKVSDEQDWLKQGVISYELRSIARTRHIPIFSAVQLNRKGGKDSEDAIGLHRLARSAQIATHATCVVQIESRKNEEGHPDLNYWIIKNRNGPKGKGKLIKNLASATLIDDPISKKENEFGFTNYNEDIEEKLELIEL